LNDATSPLWVWTNAVVCVYVYNPLYYLHISFSSLFLACIFPSQFLAAFLQGYRSVQGPAGLLSNSLVSDCIQSSQDGKKKDSVQLQVEKNPCPSLHEELQNNIIKAALFYIGRKNPNSIFYSVCRLSTTRASVTSTHRPSLFRRIHDYLSFYKERFSNG